MNVVSLKNQNLKTKFKELNPSWKKHLLIVCSNKIIFNGFKRMLMGKTGKCALNENEQNNRFF